MATEDRRAYARDYYWRNREHRLAMKREWYAANKEAQAEYRKRRGDHRKYRDRRAYAREWWARLREANPAAHAAYVKRSNQTRALHGLPAQVYEMRTVLFEFRSRLGQGRKRTA